MPKTPRTEAPPVNGRLAGRAVHPLCIDAKTGAIVTAVVFDADAGAVFIVGGDASTARPDRDSHIVHWNGVIE